MQNTQKAYPSTTHITIALRSASLARILSTLYDELNVSDQRHALSVYVHSHGPSMGYGEGILEAIAVKAVLSALRADWHRLRVLYVHTELKSALQHASEVINTQENNTPIFERLVLCSDVNDVA